MEAGLQQIALLSAVGWSSGFNVYLTASILGIGSRLGWVTLPGGMDVLGHPLIIALAVTMFAVEFVADKIPFVDSAWDSVHTFIRPTAAAFAGYLAGTEYGPLAQTALATFTGTLALDAHAVKATTRAAINTSPEPFSNIAASLGEDTFVIFLLWFVHQHPWITLAIVLTLVVLSYFILRMLWGFLKTVFRWITGSRAPARQELSGGGSPPR